MYCIILYKIVKIWVVATQIFFKCSSLFVEMIQFDQYFSDGLKPPTSSVFVAGRIK